MADLRTLFFKPGTEELLDPLILHHERLWKGDKIIIPRRRVADVIRACHGGVAAGLWGIARTPALVQRRYFFPSMKDQVRQYVKSCDICQRCKSDRHLPIGHIENLWTPTQKGESMGDLWESISMCWVSLPPIGLDGVLFNEVLTVADRATKSTIFTSIFWKELMKLYDIDHHFTSPFTHQQMAKPNVPTRQCSKFCEPYVRSVALEIGWVY